METLTPLILVAVISMGIGLFVGLLLMSLRGDDAKGQKAPPPVPQAREVARVWEDRKNGEILIETQGQVFRSQGEMSQGQRAKLEPVLDAVRRWAEGARPAVAPSAASTPRDIQMLVQEDKEKEETAKRSNVVDFFARAINPGKPAGPPVKSIVAQIDEVLQEKLAGSSLESRAIRLLEMPGQGMVVMIGLEKYEGVEAVPDPEIRSLIRESVKEWEAKSDDE